MSIAAYNSVTVFLSAVSLYGVVEHSGGLSGGHYTACVKVRPSRQDLSHFFSPSLSRPGQTSAVQSQSFVCLITVYIPR